MGFDTTPVGLKVIAAAIVSVGTAQFALCWKKKKERHAFLPHFCFHVLSSMKTKEWKTGRPGNEATVTVIMTSVVLIDYTVTIAKYLFSIVFWLLVIQIIAN